MRRDMRYCGALLAALLVCAAAGCTGRDAKGTHQDPASTTGTVNLSLIAGDGIEITRVDYTVTNAGGDAVASDHIDLSDPQATFQVRLTLPAGTGYTISMSAQTTAGDPCSGSAVFDVVASASQQVSIDLVCEGENDGNGTGDVIINGNVVSRPGSACPDVAFVSASPLQTSVGGAIALRASATSSASGVSVGWSVASGSGTIAASGAANTTFTCTGAGTALLSFSVTQATQCTDSVSVQVNCVGAAPDAGTPDAGGGDSGINYCQGLGGGCHEVDPGEGPLHECHQIGHGTDQAACQAVREECIDMCGAAMCELVGSTCHDVDPGTGPLHDCHVMGHAGDADVCFAQGRACFRLCQAAAADAGTPDASTPDAGTPDASEPDASEPDAGTPDAGEPDAGPPPPRAVTIRFRPEVNGASFACGQTYAGIGSTSVSATAQDFRFFVQNLRLINAAGEDVPVQVATRSPWQVPEVSLIDFEDGQGECFNGNPETNGEITGTVPAGTYTGVAFTNGIPAALNHGNPATAPAPLTNAPGALWAWLSGYKFYLFQMGQVVPAGQTAGLGLIHGGSGGCTGNPQAGTVTCSRSNRNEVRLTNFNPDTNEIVVDLGAILAETDVAVDSQCHGSGAVCPAPYARLGVDFATGAALPTQVAYHVE